jgi:hypothetical protein
MAQGRGHDQVRFDAHQRFKAWLLAAPHVKGANQRFIVDPNPSPVATQISHARRNKPQ